MPSLIPAVFILVLGGFAIFWIRCFTQLMMLEDRDLPGRNDKMIWGAAFVLVAPLAPFAFELWKAGVSEATGREH